MKKNNKALKISLCLVAVMTLTVAFFTICGLPVAAESEKTMNKYTYEDVDQIISETLNLKVIDQILNNLGEKTPKNYAVRKDEYIVEYPAGKGFADEFKRYGLDIKAMISGTYYLSVPPTIYVPFFTEIEGEERVFGHAKLYYNLLEDRYTMIPVYYGNPTDLGQFEHFYEKLDKMRQEGKISGEAILLKPGTSFNDFADKIAVVGKGEEVKIIDLYNGANSTDGKVIYDYDEFYPVLVQKEQGGTSGLANDGGSITGKEKSAVMTAVLIISISLIAVITLGMVVLFKVKRQGTVRNH